MRVLIADDYAVVRRGIRQIIEDHWQHVAIGEAGNGQDVLHEVQANEWDVLVLDLSMPLQSGLDIVTELKHQCPELPILVLSIYPEEQFAVRLLRGGVAGYLPKECAPKELVTAIEKVLAGGKYISTGLGERIAFSLDRWAEKRLHDTLTDREFQVMRLLASGKPVGEVATALTLSVKTIGTYRRNILQKLKLRNNAELVSYAIHHDLIDLPKRI